MRTKRMVETVLRVRLAARVLVAGGGGELGVAGVRSCEVALRYLSSGSDRLAWSVWHSAFWHLGLAHSLSKA